MHIDPALQAMIDQSVQEAPNAAGQTYAGTDPVIADLNGRVQGESIAKL